METKVSAIAICVFLAVAIFDVTFAADPPTSRPVGYSVTIPAQENSNVQVIATGDYVVSLEGAPCAITVRHFYSNSIAHLLWTANYYVGSLVTATQCTLTLSASGDLQLLALFQGTNTLLWHSDTANKGVTRMALENVFDSGDLQLLGAQNQVVFHSFGVPEFAVLPTQKFTPGQVLVAPNAIFNDSYNQVLFSGGIYSLKLQNGDLRLYSNFGAGEKQYWSLHQTLYQGDLSQVAYAGIVVGEGGLALFKADGSVVYTTGPLPLIGVRTNPHDVYFSVDADGNLRTHNLVKGIFWDFYFEALPTNCDLPSFCGPYGVCSKNTTCSCSASFTPINRKDLTQGCKPQAGFAKCGASNERFLRLTGYDYNYNQYATALHLSVKDCNSKCLKDCSCKAYFYNQKTGLCYLSNEVRTLKKVSDNSKLAFIRL